MNIEYVRFVSSGESISSGVRSDTIYKVIDHKNDWFLLKVKGKAVYVDSSNCRASNKEDYLNQYRKQTVEEEYNEAGEISS